MSGSAGGTPRAPCGTAAARECGASSSSWPSSQPRIRSYISCSSFTGELGRLRSGAASGLRWHRAQIRRLPSQVSSTSTAIAPKAGAAGFSWPVSTCGAPGPPFGLGSGVTASTRAAAAPVHTVPLVAKSEIATAIRSPAMSAPANFHLAEAVVQGARSVTSMKRVKTPAATSTVANSRRRGTRRHRPARSRPGQVGR